MFTIVLWEVEFHSKCSSGLIWVLMWKLDIELIKPLDGLGHLFWDPKQLKKHLLVLINDILS